MTLPSRNYRQHLHRNDRRDDFTIRTVLAAVDYEDFLLTVAQITAQTLRRHATQLHKFADRLP